MVFDDDQNRLKSHPPNSVSSSFLWFFFFLGLMNIMMSTEESNLTISSPRDRRTAGKWIIGCCRVVYFRHSVGEVFFFLTTFLFSTFFFWMRYGSEPDNKWCGEGRKYACFFFFFFSQYNKNRGETRKGKQTNKQTNKQTKKGTYNNQMKAAAARLLLRVCWIIWTTSIIDLHDRPNSGFCRRARSK